MMEGIRRHRLAGQLCGKRILGGQMRPPGTGTEEIMEKKRRENDKGVRILIFVLAVVCLFAGGVYIDTFYGGGRLKAFATQITKKDNARASRSRESMPIDSGNQTAVAAFGLNFALCTKDGVKYYAGMGDQKWNDTFNMASPVAVSEGEYIAVGDMSGKTVRVYDGAGLLYSLQTDGSLVQFALNKNGYLALITKETDSYRIFIYNAKGSLLKERVEESSGVYPLSADISDDNRAFAVSYLDTADITPTARVLSFYINTSDSEEYTDSMFAAVEKTDEVIPVVSYWKDGTLAALSDKSIYGISAKDGQEAWQYELENTVDYASFGAEDYIVVALGDSVANRDGRERGTVCWIDSSGKERASFENGETVTYLNAGAKGVVVGSGREYKGLTHNGSLAWNYKATADTGDLIPMEKLGRVMAVTQESIEILDMTKEQTPVSAEPEAAPAEPGASPENGPGGEPEGGTPESGDPSAEPSTQEPEGAQGQAEPEGDTGEPEEP